MFRSLTYAYPSSPNARKFGCAISGCFIVSVLNDDGTAAYQHPHNELADALRHYDAMPSLETHKFTCIRHRFPAADAKPTIASVQRTVCYGSCTLHAKFSDGETRQLFSYYIDELSFSDAELYGKTEDEAHSLRQSKDMAYLRS